MSDEVKQEYLLGTHDEEIERLGVQHRAWRPQVLACWRRAGITAGSRVLDVGAGPGYATVDLAEIVGPAGRVLAIERSARFLAVAREACARRGLANVDFREMDLMTEPLGASGLDASWCRWVAAFVSSPARLVAEIARALRPGGVAMFHEYGAYETWRLAPRGPAHDSFVSMVVKSWRETGGEPDVGLELPGLLDGAGFRLRSASPLIFALRPDDYMWRWPAGFIEIHLRRQLEQGRVERAWADSVLRELRAAEADPASLMITPLVLEVVAEKIG
ncbi:MAG TPA: methyltransferase domain-containing protein [Candidatus Eisenbacteria bacterium]|jgi:SAM-dependent methyltransferase